MIDKTDDAYKATAQVEIEVARFLFERKREGRPVMKMSTIKRHMESYHSRIVGDAVLEVQDMVHNLVNRKMVKLHNAPFAYHDMNPGVEWVANDLDTIMFLSNEA